MVRKDASMFGEDVRLILDYVQLVGENIMFRKEVGTLAGEDVGWVQKDVIGLAYHVLVW